MVSLLLLWQLFRHCSQVFVVKVGLSNSKKKICIISLNASPLKMMKNDFCFMLKALFVLKMFNFTFFNHVGKRLDKKAKVNLKIYDVTTWIKSQTTSKTLKHILPSISRSTGD